MSDSEDEFLSASEGEDSLIEEVILKKLNDNVEKEKNIDISLKNNEGHKEKLVKEEVNKKQDNELINERDNDVGKDKCDNDWDCNWDSVLTKSISFKKIEKIYRECDEKKEEISIEESFNDEDGQSETTSIEIIEQIKESVGESFVVEANKVSKNECHKEEKSRDIKIVNEESLIEEKTNEEEIMNEGALDIDQCNDEKVVKDEEKVELQSKHNIIEELKEASTTTEGIKPKIKVVKPRKKIIPKKEKITINKDVIEESKKPLTRNHSNNSSSQGTDISYENIETPKLVEENDWFSEVTKEIITKNKEVKSSKKSSTLWDWSAINAVVSSVGDSISSAVESSLGIPSAEEMARTVSKEEKDKVNKEKEERVNPLDRLNDNIINQPDIPSIGGIFSGLVNTSLDALETIGKKTFETLTITEKDGDKERRKFLFEREKDINLSDILKELKNKEKEDNKDNTNSMKSIGFGSTSQKTLTTSFVQLFEKHGGLVNLEGLELLTERSKDASTLTTNFVEHVEEMSLTELSPISMDNFERELKKLCKKMKVSLNPNFILTASKNQEEIYLESTLLDNSSIETIFENAINSLALMTAESVHLLHKIGQLFSITPQICEDNVVIEITKLFCKRVTYFSEEYANIFNSLNSDPKIDEMVTNIFYESTNANLYIKKAVMLLKVFY
uniref:Uncharacterized protein n=1 Tax=Parastrongyloides trichosuri TaxID=131310 RepID=A0A0N4ZRA2_PARTI